MNKIAKILLLAALLGASASASAWSGGPWGGWPGSSSWADDWFGDGWGDFNLSMSGGGRGWGSNRHYNHHGPWWGGPYGYGGYPYAGYSPYAAPEVPQAPAAAESK
jgi:hypothetical protein